MNITWLKILSGRRWTSWLIKGVAEELNSGLPRTTPTGGQNGNSTPGRLLACKQALRVATESPGRGLLYGKDRGARRTLHVGVKKVVLVSLRMFSLKSSTARAFVVLGY